MVAIARLLMVTLRQKELFPEVLVRLRDRIWALEGKTRVPSVEVS